MTDYCLDTLSGTPISPLRKAREDRGFSREWVGGQIGVTAKTVERHEGFATPVKAWMLEKYAELYRVPVGRLKPHLRREMAA